MNTLLRNYLEWQSEMGTDEVIFPTPFAFSSRKSDPALVNQIELASSLTRSPDASINSNQPFTHAPAFQSTSPSNLFGDLSRALAEVNTTSKKNTPNAGTSTFRAEAIEYPDFPDLKAYGEYFRANASKLYGSGEQLEVVLGAGPTESPISLVSLMPAVNENDVPSGPKLFSSNANVLLGKMMKAIHFDLDNLYVTCVIKQIHPGKIWSRREWVRILPLFHMELKLVKSPIIVLLGEACGQSVLKTGKTLDEMRQTPFRESGQEFMVTYHPNDLLLKEELKRKAWEDLQWLKKRLTESKADR